MAGKTNKKLTVRMIQELHPKSEVYELNSYSKYIIMLKKSNIITQQNEDLMRKGQELLRIFVAHNIPCAIFVGSLDDVQIVELQGVKE